MGFVGLDPQAATALAGTLGSVVQDLHGHADAVDGLLRQAGFQSDASRIMHEVGDWAAYRRRDLQRRIDKIVAADTGAVDGLPAGFRFADPDKAVKAGQQEADRIKWLLAKAKPKDVDAELARIEQYASAEAARAMREHLDSIEKGLLAEV